METIPMSKKWTRIAWIIGALGGPPAAYAFVRGLFASLAFCAQPTANAAHLEIHDTVIEKMVSKECVAELKQAHKDDISAVAKTFSAIQDDIAAIKVGQGEMSGKVDTVLMLMQKGVQP